MAAPPARGCPRETGGFRWLACRRRSRRAGRAEWDFSSASLRTSRRRNPRKDQLTDPLRSDRDLACRGARRADDLSQTPEKSAVQRSRRTSAEKEGLQALEFAWASRSRLLTSCLNPRLS